MKFALLAATMLATPALSQDLEARMKSTSNALGLGTVLASETACSLTLDPAGIAAWIAANVAPDDLSFAANLNLLTMGQTAQVAAMTTSSRIAHCAAVKQTAGAMGLVVD